MPDRHYAGVRQQATSLPSQCRYTHVVVVDPVTTLPRFQPFNPTVFANSLPRHTAFLAEAREFGAVGVYAPGLGSYLVETMLATWRMFVLRGKHLQPDIKMRIRTTIESIIPSASLSPSSLTFYLGLAG